jgi:hypothetical protein
MKLKKPKNLDQSYISMYDEDDPFEDSFDGENDDEGDDYYDEENDGEEEEVTEEGGIDESVAGEGETTEDITNNIMEDNDIDIIEPPPIPPPSLSVLSEEQSTATSAITIDEIQEGNGSEFKYVQSMPGTHESWSDRTNSFNNVSNNSKKKKFGGFAMTKSQTYPAEEKPDGIVMEKVMQEEDENGEEGEILEEATLEEGGEVPMVNEELQEVQHDVKREEDVNVDNDKEEDGEGDVALEDELYQNQEEQSDDGEEQQVDQQQQQHQGNTQEGSTAEEISTITPGDREDDGLVEETMITLERQADEEEAGDEIETEEVEQKEEEQKEEEQQQQQEEQPGDIDQEENVEEEEGGEGAVEEDIISDEEGEDDSDNNKEEEQGEENNIDETNEKTTQWEGFEDEDMAKQTNVNYEPTEEPPSPATTSSSIEAHDISEAQNQNDYQGDGFGTSPKYQLLRGKGNKGGGGSGIGTSKPSINSGGTMIAGLIVLLTICLCYLRYRRRKNALKPRYGNYAALGKHDFFNGTFSDDISYGKNSDGDDISIESWGSDYDNDDGRHHTNLEMGDLHELDANGGLTLEEVNG